MHQTGGPTKEQRHQFATTTKSAGRFLPEIQGVRAIAVGLVILYHVTSGQFPRGGFVGVDVFFVISGFLITRHLTGEIERTGTVRLRHFYRRRATRLLPAALVVLAATLVVTFIWVPQTLWADNGRQVIASAFYVENWALAANAVNYAAPAADTSPVQHFWSLGIEEQFYLAWPLLLLAAVYAAARTTVARSRPAMLAAIGLVIVVSFTLSVTQTMADAGLAYFTTQTRVWELAIGGALSFGVGWLWQLPNGARVAMAWLGLGLVAVAAVDINGTSRFPGAIALVPVIGAALLIAAGRTRGVVAPSHILRTRPMQSVGDNSYSLYLWHWPILILLPFIVGAPIGGAQKAVVVVITSLVLAWLSKRFVEDRFRDRGPAAPSPGRRTYIVLGTTLSASVVIAAAAITLVAVAENRTREATIELDAALRSASPCFGAAAVDSHPSECEPDGNSVIVPDPIIAGREPTGLRTSGCLVDGPSTTARACDFGRADSPVRVALVGDSHAAQWLIPLVGIARQQNWRLTTYLKSGCPASTNQPVSMDRYGDACSTWNRNVMQRIRHDGYSAVIVAAFSGLRYAERRGESQEAAAARGYAGAWKGFIDSGRQVIAIRDNPLPEEGGVHDTPTCVERSEDVSACATSLRPNSRPDPQATAAALVPGVRQIDLTRYFCPDGKTCPAVIGRVLVYDASGHVTKTYARTMQAPLERRIRALLVTDTVRPQIQ